jgi:RHS repeat-associated protein
MMKRTRIALLASALLLGCVVTLGAATPPKFRPSGSDEAGVGRYIVTLTEDAGVEDPAALRRELALLYGARLEADTSSGVRQFAVTMTPERARLLSADPRVIEVAEVPLSTTAAAPPGTSSVASASTDRRFATRPSGYGDNGQSGTYTYDGAGNITAIGADTYLYDTAQRLVHSVTRGVQEDYSYDAFGNRMSATGAINCLGQTTCAQTVTVDSNTNHLTTINNGNVTYEAAGNIATISGSPGAVYSYDGTGMMTEATVGSDDRQFIYTAEGERIAVRQGASWTWTVRDLDGKVLREFTSLETGPNLAMTNRQWVKDYVWRDGLLLATTTPTGTLHYHLDHLGTPRLVTDGNGVKVAEHAYYPFGAEINLTPHETPEEAMKFTGHERDIVAGDGHTLDYMHARYDNASLGRFLSVDPNIDLDQDLPEPQRWNRYAYVTNNPLRYMDANGRERLQAYHLNRQPVPNQGFKQELITVAKPAAVIAALAFGSEVAAGAVTAFLTNPAGVTNAIVNALTPGPGGGSPFATGSFTSGQALEQGLVRSGGKLAGVIGAIEQGAATAKPGSANAAMEVVQQAVTSQGLEPGLAVKATGGSAITLQNVGNVTTQIYDTGRIVVKQGETVVLDLIQKAQ